jgi:hypothetical protein
MALLVRATHLEAVHSGIRDEARDRVAIVVCWWRWWWWMGAKRELTGGVGSEERGAK